eukprot:6196824-Pleurochrysis_carterae.AAC.3
MAWTLPLAGPIPWQARTQRTTGDSRPHSRVREMASVRAARASPRQYSTVGTAKPKQPQPSEAPPPVASARVQGLPGKVRVSRRVRVTQAHGGEVARGLWLTDSPSTQSRAATVSGHRHARGCTYERRESRGRVRTCAGRPCDGRLAAAANCEVGRRLDVIPLLLGEGIDAAYRQRARADQSLYSRQFEHCSAPEVTKIAGTDARKLRMCGKTRRSCQLVQKSRRAHIFFPFPFLPFERRLFLPTAMTHLAAKPRCRNERMRPIAECAENMSTVGFEDRPNILS